jgi:DNA-binding NarL/FixJ family response regulator
VDDEPRSTEALRMLIEAKGFRCLSTSDMTSALHILSQENVSVVVSDIMMPGGEDFPDIDSSQTGFQLANTIRETFPNVRVICLSVIGDQERIQALKRRGILYLRKGETPLNTAASLIESKATGLTKF